MGNIYIVFIIGFIVFLGLFYAGMKIREKSGIDFPNSNEVSVFFNPMTRIAEHNWLCLAEPLHNGKMPRDARVFLERELNRKGIVSRKLSNK